MRIHATCIAIDGKGVLLMGPSGSGKSDLALRLIDTGAQLVADDQVELRVHEGKLLAAPPLTIAGQIEARHVGILTLPFVRDVPVALSVRLVTNRPERLPEPAMEMLLGSAIPRCDLPAFEAATPAKIRLAVRYFRFSDLPASLPPNSSPNMR